MAVCFKALLSTGMAFSGRDQPSISRIPSLILKIAHRHRPYSC